MEVSTAKLLKDARQGGYAVPAVCISNLETIVALFRAAQAKKAPVIVQVYDSQKDYQHISYADLCVIIRQIAKSYDDVPYSIHLDHGASVEDCREAYEGGLVSLMIDASMCPLEENARITNQVRAFSDDIFIEAEMGHVGGNEGDKSADMLSAMMTSPEDLEKFLKLVRIDAIAVSIGNAHGVYIAEPKLDFERLRALEKISTVPLVLHGASGIPESEIREAIKLGITKINYYTELDHCFMETHREYADTDMLTVIDKNTLNLQKKIEHIIDMCHPC